MEKQQQANEQHWKLLVLMLKKIAKETSITHQEIAEKTGLQKSNVTRVFSLKYCPTMANFLAIANAIGVNFFFEDKDSTVELNEIFEQAMTELGRRPDNLSEN